MTILIITCMTLISFAYIKKQSIWLYILAVLPSTFLHELSHWLVAVVLGARPSFPSLLPKKMEGNYWVLGSVEFQCNPFTAALIALAPLWLLGGFVAFMLLEGWHLSADWWVGVLMGVMLVGSFPSRTDWAIALRNPLGLLIVGLCFWGEIELLMGSLAP